MTLMSAIAVLILVMDPFGNIPFFVAALEPVAPSRHTRVVVRELVIALGVMIVFLFAGRYLLAIFGISEPALTIAGGVILFLIAIRMVFPSPNRYASEELQGEPFIVPLAIPYVAGPSVLASELLLMSREPDRWPTWLLAIFIAWAVTAIVVTVGSRVRKFLGVRGLIAIERLMGMLLVAVAIEMLLKGLTPFFG